MELATQSAVEADKNAAVLEKEHDPSAPAYVSALDPFLVEALQNPRHRLTSACEDYVFLICRVVRMFGFGVKLFEVILMRNPSRDCRSLAREIAGDHIVSHDNSGRLEDFKHGSEHSTHGARAHRVAQHYGLQTMVQDNVVDGQGIRILAIKKPVTKIPAVRLSDVRARDSENDKFDQTKIVIRPRDKASSSDANQLWPKRSPVRSVDERKEEYDRARARIFSSPVGSDSEDTLARVDSDGKNLNVEENEISRSLSTDGDKGLYNREIGSSSRVAIFRDRVKDRTDPDYDRSYDRFVKSIPSTQRFSPAPFNMQKFQPPFVQYDPLFHGQMHASQAPLSYRSLMMSPYCNIGLNQTSRDGFYIQWPTESMMYGQSYDPLRNAFFQASFCQQPLSFDYSQSHRRL